MNPLPGMGRRLLPALRCIGRHAKIATGKRGEGIAVRLWQQEISGTAAKTPICSRRCGTAFRALRCPLFLSPPTAVWCIISYLRNLSGKNGAANEIVPGDVAADEKIFWSKVPRMATRNIQASDRERTFSA